MRSLSLLLTVVLVAGIATTITGCASTGSTTTDRSDVLGVWEYRTNGTPYLGRGRFQIVLTKDGRLDGRLRDSRLGTVNLDDVRLRNGQMHLRIEVQRAYSAQTSTLQISGRVEDDRYTATFRRPMFDVTTSQHTRRTASSTSGGSILARRVRTSSVHDMPVPLGCTDVLVEHNYHCR
jgi:hypothetical protein